MFWMIRGMLDLLKSPSSRRAWIEIGTFHLARASSRVALLAEGVDRNRSATTMSTAPATSPSSRRAWIEIAQRHPQ